MSEATTVLIQNQIAILQKRLGASQDDAELLIALGDLFGRSRRYAEAAEVLRRATTLRPADARAEVLLGWAMFYQHQHESAREAFVRAARIAPDYDAAHAGLAAAMLSTGRFGEGLSAARRAVAVNPRNGQAYQSMALCQFQLRRLEEALASLDRALSLQYAPAISAQTRLLLLHYVRGDDGPAMFAEHRAWADRFAPKALSSGVYSNDRTADRVLRIGYLSADFRSHPVASFFEPLLVAHDTSAVEVALYFNHPTEDAVSARLKKTAMRWRNIHSLSDASAAQLIAEDRVDILVDLSGHTAGNRLGIMMRQPAPVAMTGIGYPNTTGLPQIAYRLTDEWHCPSGTDAYHTEKLIRLAGGAWAWQPHAEAPAVTSSPCERNGFVTFLSPNKFPKVTDQMTSLWRQIVHQVPDARLIVVTAGDRDSDDEFRRLMGNLPPERLRLVGRQSLRDYLELFGTADIVLDTFPFAGHTTTCDALWQGCPVITLSGRTHVSRAGMSVLSVTGFPELVAESPAKYVQLAVSLATDRPRLVANRLALRDRIRSSPLFDGRRLAREVERGFRTAWEDWLRSTHSPGGG